MSKSLLLGVVFIVAACARTAYVPVTTQQPDTSQNAVLRTSSGIESTFYAFPKLQAGRIPNSPAIFDAHGDVFGSTYAGGNSDSGVIYELVPTATGFSETKLFDFPSSAGIGKNPGPIVMDSGGNIWGTSSAGIFELQKTSSGYHMRLVYECFQGNGLASDAEVTLGQFGYVYASCSSAVIVLQPKGLGYSATMLHVFNQGYRGINLNGGLAVDNLLRVYGTTNYGGSLTSGTVFRLQPLNGAVGYSERTLHTFGAAGDGARPWAGVTMDASGNLYGTTAMGGQGNGVVYKLAPNSDGTYTETILDNSSEPRPVGRPIVNAAGDFYFTATGSFNTVFKLTPSGSGYSETALFKTLGPLTYDTLFMDSAGNVYGTTFDGGKGCPSNLGCGFIYKIAQ